MSQSTTAGTSGRDSISEVIGVVADAQTYKNLLYLVLAFPLGLIYYIILVFGFTLGLALSVLVVGLGILLGTAIGLRYVASFERRLANWLLDTEIAAPDDVERDREGLVGTAKAYLGASSTWRGLGFVILKFWLGLLSFVLLLSFLGTAIEFLLLPLYPEGALDVELAGWEVARTFETSTQRALAVPAGAVLALLALHVLNAFADANATIASSLLGSETADRTEPDQSA